MNENLSGLDLIALFDQLEPLPEPPSVSLWPQTVAWIWVGLIVVTLAAWIIRSALLRRRANAYRRAALREIALAESPAALAAILRRTALAAFSRSEVAGLYGDEWLTFLDRTGGLDRTGDPDRTNAGSDFREGVGRVLAQAPYTPENTESTELAVLAARWVRHHRNDAETGA